MVETQYKALLYQALGSPMGLVLRSNDPERARQTLYSARREAQDPELDVLQIRMKATPDGDLVLVKREFAVPKELGPQELDL